MPSTAGVARGRPAGRSAAALVCLGALWRCAAGSAATSAAYAGSCFDRSPGRSPAQLLCLGGAGGSAGAGAQLEACREPIAPAAGPGSGGGLRGRPAWAASCCGAAAPPLGSTIWAASCGSATSTTPSWRSPVERARIGPFGWWTTFSPRAQQPALLQRRCRGPAMRCRGCSPWPAPRLPPPP